MKTKIKIGVLGAGRMAGWFSEGLTVVEDAVRYAVGSRTLEKAQAFADKYGYEKAYGSYEEILQDPEVDLVYIATPIRNHYANIKVALEANKNVLCEKSLTVNAAQAEEVVALARSKGLFLMEAVWTLCQPVYRKIREWAENGLLGEIRAADGNFYTAAGKGHRLYNADTGGGALLDLGFYPVTFACTFLGMHPDQILSHTIMGTHPGQPPADTFRMQDDQNRACRNESADAVSSGLRAGDSAVDFIDSIVLTYPNGSFAHLSTGLGEKKRAAMFLMGTKGRVALQDELFFQAQKAQALNFDNEVLDSIEEPFLKNGYEYEAMEAIRCLQEGRTESELVPLDDSIAVMRILDICRANAGFKYPFEK